MANATSFLYNHLKRSSHCREAEQGCPRPPMRRKNAQKLVHTDVCYVDAKSQASAQYFVTFIDDYSWKLWASVLKTKDQMLFIFKEFQAR